MAPLFSKVDLNKLWHDVQNEETLICAKFGKDPFNISKVIGRKKWPSFFDSQCIFAVLLHLIIYKPSYSRFCLKFCCHDNQDRPSQSLTDIIGSPVFENPQLDVRISVISLIQDEL